MKNIALVGALVASTAAHAQTILETGFESPTWSAGTTGANMVGGANAAQGYKEDTRLSGGASIVANGQANAGGVTAATGTQMLRLTTGTSSGSYVYAYKDTAAAWAGRTVGNNILHTSMQFFVPTTNNRSANYGIQFYDASGNFNHLGTFDFQPSGSTNNSLVEIRGNERDLTQVRSISVAKTTLRGAWQTVDFYFDFNTFTATGFLKSGTSSLKVGTINLDRTYAANGLGEIDFFAYNGSTQTGTTVGQNSVYLDNFKSQAIKTMPVPEPASLATLGLGAMAFFRRRRNAKA